MRNKLTWEKDSVVSEYSAASALQAPEKTIFGELGARLSGMDVLDIGVGGGRTTLHLAPAARAYVGVDCSNAMIDACKRRFGNRFPNASFLVGDATELRAVPSSSFDLIVFSYNGIDGVSHDDRLRVFREIHRVGRQDALFCFSSHNILSVRRLNPLRRHISRNPLRTARNLAGWLSWTLRHRPTQSAESLRASPYAVINDGAHDNGLYQYYVSPREQMAQLQPWCSQVRVFALADGQEIIGQAEVERSTERWLYYLARLKAKAA